MNCNTERAKLDSQDWEIRLIPHNLPKAMSLSDSCEIVTGTFTTTGDKKEISCVQTIPFPNGDAGIIDCSGLKDPEFKISGEPTCRDKKNQTCGCSGVRNVWGCAGDPVAHLYNTPIRCEKVNCGGKLTVGSEANNRRGVSLNNSWNEYVANAANTYCNVRGNIGKTCSNPSKDYKITFPTASISISASGSHVLRCRCNGKQTIVPFSYTVTGYVSIGRELTIPAICKGTPQNWVTLRGEECDRGEQRREVVPSSDRGRIQCPEHRAFFCCARKDVQCTPTVGVFRKGGSKTSRVMCNNDCEEPWSYTEYLEPYDLPKTIDDLCDMEENGCKKGGYLPGCSTPFTSTLRASDLINVLSQLDNFASYAMSSLFANTAFLAGAKATEKLDCGDDNSVGFSSYIVDETDFNSASGSFSWADKPADLKTNARISRTIDGETTTWDAGIGPGA